MSTNRKKQKYDYKKFIGTALVILGILLFGWFIWTNYSARIYQAIYSFNYEKRENTSDGEKDFAVFDDMPEILKPQYSGVLQDVDPSLEGGQPPKEPAESKAPQKKPDFMLDKTTAVSYVERGEYIDYDMGLVVPRMGVKTLIAGGTDSKSLKIAPGLYDISNLPNSGKGNVIIAGHRDIYGAWFYSIDKLKKGDKLKLYFGDKIYTYLYKDTTVIEKNDWSLLKENEEQQLVLTTCHPKGTSEKRIVVRATQQSVQSR